MISYRFNFWCGRANNCTICDKPCRKKRGNPENGKTNKESKEQRDRVAISGRYQHECLVQLSGIGNGIGGGEKQEQQGRTLAELQLRAGGTMASNLGWEAFNSPPGLVLAGPATRSNGSPSRVYHRGFRGSGGGGGGGGGRRRRRVSSTMNPITSALGLSPALKRGVFHWQWPDFLRDEHLDHHHNLHPLRLTTNQRKEKKMKKERIDKNKK